MDSTPNPESPAPALAGPVPQHLVPRLAGSDLSVFRPGTGDEGMTKREPP